MTITDSTNVATSPTRHSGRTGATPAPNLTQRRVFVSEWIKLASLRSSVWSLVVIALAIVGGGAFTAVGILVKVSPPAAEAIAAEPSGGALSGVGLAQAAVIALGVLSVTGEYRTTTIRTSVAAVPTRAPLVWGKAVVLATVTAVVSLVALLLSFVVARSVLTIENLSVSLTTPGVARALVGAALALGVTAALATGFGWLLRSTTGAVFVLLALFYVVPSFAALLPFAGTLMPFLPGNAVAGLTQVTPVDGALPPWAGLAVYAGYAVIALAAAALLLKRRDA